MLNRTSYCNVLCTPRAQIYIQTLINIQLCVHIYIYIYIYIYIITLQCVETSHIPAPLMGAYDDICASQHACMHASAYICNVRMYIYSCTYTCSVHVLWCPFQEVVAINKFWKSLLNNYHITYIRYWLNSTTTGHAVDSDTLCRPAKHTSSVRSKYNQRSTSLKVPTCATYKQKKC